MIEHALKLLEFERVRAEVADCCAGAYSRELLAASPILFDGTRVRDERERARAMRLLLDAGKNIPPFELPDLSPLIRLLGKQGTVAEGGALVGLAVFIRSAGLLKRFLSDDGVAAMIRETALSLPVPLALEKEIFRVFDSEGEIQFKAIPVLFAIHTTIKRLQAEIEKTAAAILSSPDKSGFFQTNLATIKDGRTVLPLKAQHKGKLKGIIHEVSGRGQTLFLEPEAIVEKNNRLVVEEHRFQAELHKLLRELTEKARGHLPDIERMFETASVLDILIAKARYAVRHRCSAALEERRGIVLREARHPLLGPGAVPLSLSLSDDETVLLITGPNTGGKTVTLKTVGLLACMNQFGMEIPAAEGTALPVFDGVFADIGDEQSIEQSLSTFQAHMKNIASIASRATKNSLVLLDELGAGTDPQEGTAIAMALLDHFVETGTITLATTHHGILKNYGFSKQGVVNASVEFDAERLSPTYRLIMGIPGESHALTIAERNGVPVNIMRKAAHYLSGERTDIGRMVEELVAEKRRLLERGEAQKEKEQAAEEKLRGVELKELTLRQRERELREQGIGDLAEFLSLARRTLERIVREIREGAHSEAVAEGRELIGQIEERLHLEERAVGEIDRVLDRGAPGPLAVGDRVLVRETGRDGVILRALKGDRFVVAVGNLRVTMGAAELEPAGDEPDFREDAVEVIYSRSAGATVPVFELNVRGFRFADAIRALEKQLDAVLVAGFREFTILHGKGTGALQRGIHDYLSQSPYVESFHFALPEHGGAGKTVVKMK